ncbi:four and a half LIM domains protein 5 [Falco peregrinus]|uniref:four and a half LIM domains protein 5 n=1 Tax=Falco peregrinus TaxID=8954 RepID=UPI000387260A|nr:four and a half LIM domains protein 5 [Falco peregrinus]
MTSSHTDCHYCLQSLRGRKYALREENAYCVTCYDSLFANPCEECKQPIECDSKDLAYKGRHWHEGCFRCARCSRSLVEKPFAAKDEVLLCTECYSDEYSSKCFHCQKTIMPGSRKMEFKGSSWHESCFVCQYCRQPLGTKPLITKNNENYCMPCFEKQFAHHCYSCKKVITSGGLTYHDQPWHKECFVCAGCNTQLSGQRFISKDEYPYCIDCFSRLYAKKCAACKKPITALGGGKFISFEEHQWHGECFKCAKCSVSLVGQGFLTRLDDVLCQRCGSAS